MASGIRWNQAGLNALTARGGPVDRHVEATARKVLTRARVTAPKVTGELAAHHYMERVEGKVGESVWRIGATKFEGRYDVAEIVHQGRKAIHAKPGKALKFEARTGGSQLSTRRAKGGRRGTVVYATKVRSAPGKQWLTDALEVVATRDGYVVTRVKPRRVTRREF